MGAWAIGAFDNDDALEWITELQSTSGTGLLILTLQAISPTEDIGTKQASRALAAAEVVAALQGNPASDIPRGIEDWVAQNPTPVDETLRGMALIAVHRIQTESGLQALWQESKDFSKWDERLNELNARLNAS